MRITIIGGIHSDIPEDFSSFFINGVAINPKYGKPFEHQVYSLYLALRALELRQDTDYSKLRAEIVNAVLARRETCGGFWSHSLPPCPGITHFRSTSSAIRLLVEAYVDGLIDDGELIASSLHKHLSFSERLDNGGLWFCHDSLESSLSNSPDPSGEFKNNAWGSSTRNMLVLNTQIDTLVTILYVLKWVTIQDNDRQTFVKSLKAGLNALQYVLTPPGDPIQAFFQSFDSFVRKQVFNCHKDSRLLVYRAWCKVFCLYYSRLRPYLKVRFPFFVYKDGFLERDMGLLGMAFQYHLINTWDLAKLALQLEAHSIKTDLTTTLRQIVIRGLEYAFSPAYLKYIEHSFIGGRNAILACETLLTMFQRIQLLSDTWIQRYVFIRRRLPPTPALLGYDPVIIDRSLIDKNNMIHDFELDPQLVDILILPAGRYLLVNFSDTDCVLPRHTSQRYIPVWMSNCTNGSKRTTTLAPHSAMLLEQNQ